MAALADLVAELSDVHDAAEADERQRHVRRGPGEHLDAGAAAIDAVAHDLTPVLEWYERDVRDDGLEDMPYPPDYPKMPGEPKRVQPSRAAAQE